MGGTLTKDAIEKAEDLPRELVPVPEWGGDVYVQAWDEATRDAFSEYCRSNYEVGGGVTGFRRRAVMLSLVDERGTRIFEDDKVIAKKSSLVIERLFEIADRLSQITPATKAQEKKDSKPSSAPTQKDSSASA
jgi:hypothetical protein